MKVSKLLAIGSLLAAAFLFVSTANAATPTIVFAGAGSTAVFNALYDAALSSGQCGTNLFSQGGGTYPGPFTKGGTLHDNRNGHGVTIPDDNQKVWVSFDGTAAASFTDTTVICFYVGVDSGVGVRGFLAAPRASLILSGAAGSASGNQVNGYTDNVAALPQAIWNDVNVPGTACVGTTLNTCATVTGTVMNIAFSDIRPEDAQYATYRALSARAYNGAGTTAANPTYFSSTNLGYGNWNNPFDAGATPVLSGTSILSSFSSTAATPTYFEQVPGAADGISGQHVGQYATFPVGAIPIMIAVSNGDTTAGSGLGNGVPNNYALRNVDRFVVSYAVDGVLTRTRDLTGVTSAASTPLQVITREPLSGTYNTFEFTVPRTHDVQNSQEDGVWPSLAGMNPLNIKAASGGLRFRAIGTGEMVKAINGLASNAGLNTVLTNRLGYFFWSYGNILPLSGTSCTSTLNSGLPVSVAVSCTTNPSGHYLLLDGVDPLFNDPYDNPQGPLNPPTCNFASLPCPTIPFTHLNDGSYSAWNVVRMMVDPTVTTIPSSTGLGQIYNTLLTSSATKYSDFDPASNLKVFRSHRGAGWGAQGIPANGYQAVNGTMCTPSSPTYAYNYTGQDMGSDVGGAIWTISADQDYALDFQGGLTPSSTLCGQSGGANVGVVGQVQ
jgi:hypothetical protein